MTVLLETLRDTLGKMEMALGAIRESIAWTDPDGRIQWCNGAFDRLAGIPHIRILGQRFSDVIPLEENGVVIDRQRHPITLASTSDDPVSGMFSFQGAQDKRRLEMTSSRIVPSGCVTVITVIRDMTKRTFLQEQLMQAQKLEGIGQLAAGIAHEINTPVQFVGDNVRFLKDGFDDLLALLRKVDELLTGEGCTPRVTEAFSEAREEADLEYLLGDIPPAIDQTLEGLDRVASIVRAMKEFSHPGSEEKTEADVNRLLETTLTVARNEWKYVAEVVQDLDASLPTVPCRPAELNQVFLNLVVNSAQAIAAKPGENARGTITVKTRRDGDEVVIQVRDDGGGIPEDARSRIFDPFFTTKPVGQGTGQGLAIAHSYVVKSHEGSISFETESGVGTEFTIRLPLACAGPRSSTDRMAVAETVTSS